MRVFTLLVIAIVLTGCGDMYANKQAKIAFTLPNDSADTVVSDSLPADMSLIARIAKQHMGDKYFANCCRPYFKARQIPEGSVSKVIVTVGWGIKGDVISSDELDAIVESAAKALVEKYKDESGGKLDNLSITYTSGFST